MNCSRNRESGTEIEGNLAWAGSGVYSGAYGESPDEDFIKNKDYFIFL